MIVALFILALAMIVGGIASIVQGAPFIRLEMGWTMVIAGSVVMSGGAILAGVAAAVWRLRRIEMELVETREAGDRMPAMALPPTVPPGPTLPPVGVDAPALADPARREPALVSGPLPVRDAERLAPDERAVLAAGDLMPPLSARRNEEPTVDAAPPVAPPEPAPERATEPALEVPELPPPSLPAGPPLESTATASAADPTSESPPRTVAGTHASGGNTYVMYSDGSIEADTPNGKYTFASLEELKAFASSEGATVAPPGQA